MSNEAKTAAKPSLDLTTVEKLRAFLLKNLPESGDLSVADFQIFGGAILVYLEKQQVAAEALKKKNDRVGQVLEALLKLVMGEETPAETPPATEGGAAPAPATAAAPPGPDVKSNPFPEGVKWQADGPPAAGGSKAPPAAATATAQSEEEDDGKIPPPDVVARVTSVAPIPPRPPGPQAPNGAPPVPPPPGPPKGAA